MLDVKDLEPLVAQVVLTQSLREGLFWYALGLQGGQDADRIIGVS